MLASCWILIVSSIPSKTYAAPTGPELFQSGARDAVPLPTVALLLNVL